MEMPSLRMVATTAARRVGLILHNAIKFISFAIDHGKSQFLSKKSKLVSAVRKDGNTASTRSRPSGDTMSDRPHICRTNWQSSGGASATGGNGATAPRITASTVLRTPNRGSWGRQRVSSFLILSSSPKSNQRSNVGIYIDYCPVTYLGIASQRGGRPRLPNPQSPAYSALKASSITKRGDHRILLSKSRATAPTIF